MKIGKTLADAKGEITRAMEYVEHACAGPELMKGSHAEDVGTGVDTLYIREPLGPFVFLPPFNFPAMIALYYRLGHCCRKHSHRQGKSSLSDDRHPDYRDRRGM